MSWNNNQLTFNVAMRGIANNLKAMLAALFSIWSIDIYYEKWKYRSFYSANDQRECSMRVLRLLWVPILMPLLYGAITRIANPVAPKKDTLVAATTGVTTATAPQRRKKLSMVMKIKQAQSLTAKLYASALPNPSSSYFNLVINSNDPSPVSVRVTDVLGRLVEIHEKVTSTGILRLGGSVEGRCLLCRSDPGEQKNR